MKTRQEGNLITITASEAITKNRFVTPDGYHTVDKKAAGVALFDAASGDPVTVQAAGVAVVEAAGAITVGTHVYVSMDADGKAAALAIPTDSAANIAAFLPKICGIPMDSATQAGDMIRVLIR
jgi:hypothetical protein